MIPSRKAFTLPSARNRPTKRRLQEPEQGLRNEKSVVLDGTFRRAEEMKRVVNLARERGEEIWMVECTVPEQEARTGWKGASRRGIGLRRPLFHRQIGQWEPVAKARLKRHIRLDA